MDISKKLGYPQDSKLLIIHADDAGLCHSENSATIQVLEKGIVNSCSVMPTCPWFDEIAAFLKHNPQYDYGIHLTLTCEWQHYKWSPILSKSEVPSLVNNNGYFHGSRMDFKNNAHPNDIKKEFEAQIEKVYNFGLKPSHIDCHMFVLATKPEFLTIYKELSLKYQLPILLNDGLIDSSSFNDEPAFSDTDFCVEKVIVGHFDFYKKGELAHFYSSSLDNLQNGINVILIHPAFDDAEMQAITINHPNFGSDWRQIDFDFFTSEECKNKISQNNIKMITWRDIKNVLYP